MPLCWPALRFAECNQIPRWAKFTWEGCGRSVAEPQAPPSVDLLVLTCCLRSVDHPSMHSSGAGRGAVGEVFHDCLAPQISPRHCRAAEFAVAMAFAARSASASHVVLAGQGARPGPAIPRRGVAAAAVKRVVATGALGGPIEPAAESPTRGGAGRVRRGPARAQLPWQPPTLCNASLRACHCVGFTFLLTYQAPLCVQTMLRR